MFSSVFLIFFCIFVFCHVRIRIISFVAGIIDDGICSADEDWLAKWRLIFKKVTKDDIDNFIQKFKGGNFLLSLFFALSFDEVLKEKLMLVRDFNEDVSEVILM